MRIQILLVCFALLMNLGPVFAQELKRIKAEDAFNAHAHQTDPESGETSKVIIVDVRSRAEYYWVGTCARVDSILLRSGKLIHPDSGKVRLLFNENLAYAVDGVKKIIGVHLVESIKTSAISINIPYLLWRPDTGKMIPNPYFFKKISELSAGSQNTILILVCRSGGRSEVASIHPKFPFGNFKAVYEMDRSEKNGRGGIEGSNYTNVFNGYWGFPSRNTTSRKFPSVSWMDAGLPIKTGVH